MGASTLSADDSTLAMSTSVLRLPVACGMLLAGGCAGAGAAAAAAAGARGCGGAAAAAGAAGGGAAARGSGCAAGAPCRPLPRGGALRRWAP